MAEESFEKQFEDLSDERLQEIINVNGISSPRGRAAASVSKERRRQIRRSARIIAWATVATAIATVAAAIAAWTPIYFQHGQTHTAGNQAVSVAPTPSPSPQ